MVSNWAALHHLLADPCAVVRVDRGCDVQRDEGGGMLSEASRLRKAYCFGRGIVMSDIVIPRCGKCGWASRPLLCDGGGLSSGCRNPECGQFVVSGKFLENLNETPSTYWNRRMAEEYVLRKKAEARLTTAVGLMEELLDSTDAWAASNPPSVWRAGRVGKAWENLRAFLTNTPTNRRTEFSL